MNYASIEITSIGLSLDNYVAPGVMLDLNLYSSGPVTLVGNVAINPTTTALEPASFSVLWTADITLSTFSVVIAGVTISQDQVNQSGTFTCFFDGTTWEVQYFANGMDIPQAAQGVTNAIVPVGGTLTLVAGVDTAYQVLVGSPTTLTSNYTVTAGTSGIKAGSQFQVEVSGGVTLGANTMTVFGISVNANQALNGGIIIYATFDGSVWRGVSTSKPLSTADLDAIAALSVVANATNASASPTAVPFAVDGAVLKRSGTGLVANLITAANIDPSLQVMQVAIVPVSSAQILASQTTPIKVLDAPGAGYVNVVYSVLVKCTFNTTAYTTNLNANIVSFSGSDKLMVATGLWGFAASGIDQFFLYNPGAASNQYVANDILRLASSVGNPAAGDGTATVYVTYTTLAV
jgi:hypothetical protein